MLTEFSESSVLRAVHRSCIHATHTGNLSRSLIIVHRTFGGSLVRVMAMTKLRVNNLLSKSIVTRAMFSVPKLKHLLMSSVRVESCGIIRTLLLFFTARCVLVGLVMSILCNIVGPEMHCR